MLVRNELLRFGRTDTVRDAVETDAVAGRAARFVAEPTRASQVAAIMTAAAESQLAVVVRGAGTKLDWGNPPARVDLILDVSKLADVLEHNSGDLVVRVQPGVKVADLQAALAPAGQRLAIDEVVPGSTIGGVIATGLAGPARFLYGGIRDLLIGVTVVRADGVSARSGGRVVKNVAGYDLCKLYTGAYGTLGVVTEAIFRLHPIPDCSTYVSTVVPNNEVLASCVAAVMGSQVQPSAIEVNWPTKEASPTLCVLMEGSTPGVAARADRLTRLLGADALAAAEPPAWWGKLPDEVTVKLTCPPASVPALLKEAAGLADRAGIPLSLRGSAGTGIVLAGFSGDFETGPAAAFVTRLRSGCQSRGGFATVLRAPRSVKEAVDVWGPVPGLELMIRVKDHFDPDHRLAPGRFVGGI